MVGGEGVKLTEMSKLSMSNWWVSMPESIFFLIGFIAFVLLVFMPGILFPASARERNFRSWAANIVPRVYALTRRVIDSQAEVMKLVISWAILGSASGALASFLVFSVSHSGKIQNLVNLESIGSLKIPAALGAIIGIAIAAIRGRRIR
jgi:type III secretory pathway component EscT